MEFNAADIFEGVVDRASRAEGALVAARLRVADARIVVHRSLHHGGKGRQVEPLEGVENILRPDRLAAEAERQVVGLARDEADELAHHLLHQHLGVAAAVRAVALGGSNRPFGGSPWPSASKVHVFYRGEHAFDVSMISAYSLQRVSLSH